MNCCEDTGRWRAVREDAQQAPLTPERPVAATAGPDATEALLRDSAGEPPARVWRGIERTLRDEGRIRD